MAGFGQVHYTSTTSSGTNSCAVTVSSTTTNNLVVISCFFTTATPSSVSVTDNASTPNTYAQAATAGTTSTGGGVVMYQFYGVQVNGGVTTVTVNWTTNANATAYVQEYSGGATSNGAVFDKSATVVGGSSGSLAFSAFSPSTTNEMIVACYAFTSSSTTATAGNNYGLLGSGSAVTSAAEARYINAASETAPMSLSNARAYTGVAGVYILAPTSGFVSMSNFNCATSGSSVTFPGAITAGALLITTASHNSSSAISTPSGYTLLSGSSYNSNDNWAGVFYKIATGSETSFSSGAVGTTFCTAVEFLGNANPALTDGTASERNSSGSTATSFSTPPITTSNSVTNDLIVSVAIWPSSNYNASWATSTTVATTGGNASIGMYIASSPQTNFSDTATWGTSSTVISFIQAFQAQLLIPPTGEAGLLGAG